jgi:hypothetical protein
MLDPNRTITNTCRRLNADFSLIYNNAEAKWVASIYKVGGQVIASTTAENPEEVLWQLLSSVK